MPCVCCSSVLPPLPSPSPFSRPPSFPPTIHPAVVVFMSLPPPPKSTGMSQDYIQKLSLLTGMCAHGNESIVTWGSTAQIYNDHCSVVHACGREPTGGVPSLERSLGGVAAQTGWRLAVVVCRHAGMGAVQNAVWWHHSCKCGGTGRLVWWHFTHHKLNSMQGRNNPV